MYRLDSPSRGEPHTQHDRRYMVASTDMVHACVPPADAAWPPVLVNDANAGDKMDGES